MVDRNNIQVFIFTFQPELKFLLLKRTPERSGYWQAVCGGIEAGESEIEAVFREVQEETGISNYNQIVNLNYSFIYNEPKNGIPMEMQDFCYAVEIDHEKVIKISKEHEKFIWLSEQGVRKKLTWNYGLIAFEKLVSILNSS